VPAAFVEVMRKNVLSGNTPFRRAYIRSMVDQVEVDDAEILIIGRKAVLADLVMGGGPLSPEYPVLFASGAPDMIRTCGLRLRRATLVRLQRRLKKISIRLSAPELFECVLTFSDARCSAPQLPLT
jgi:hypothetical protein